MGGGAISGGIGSAIAAGDFWRGAGIGLISAGLNHGVHNGAFGKNLSMSLRSGRFRHLFGPDAKGFGVDLDMFIVGGAQVSVEGILMLRGSDTGQTATVVDAGSGAGLDFSLAGQVTDYYFFGSKRNIRLNSFTGIRHKISLAGTFGIDIGGSISYAPLNKGSLVGLSGSLGVGFPSPFGLTGNYTVGYTFAYKNGELIR